MSAAATHPDLNEVTIDEAFARFLDDPEDPWTFFARLRQERPVYRGADGTWYISRHSDCSAAGVDKRLEFFARLPKDYPMMHKIMWVTTTDGEDHKRWRKPANPAFAPGRMELNRDRVRTIVDEVLDEFQATGRMDARVFGERISVRVIGKFIGISETDDFDTLIERSFMLIHEAYNLNASPETLAAAEDAATKLYDFFNTVIANHSGEPDDLLGQLVALEHAGVYTRDETIAIAWLTHAAGFSTTAMGIASSFLYLLRNRDQLERVRNDRTLIPGAVEESLRIEGPLLVDVPLRANADLDIGGEKIQKGDLVTRVVASANRDPEVFPDPDRFDVSRSNSHQHLSFINGRHKCLGAPLARLEMRLALEAALERLPDLKLDIDPGAVQWGRNTLTRGVKTLPLRWSIT